MPHFVKVGHYWLNLDMAEVVTDKAAEGLRIEYAGSLIQLQGAEADELRHILDVLSRNLRPDFRARPAAELVNGDDAPVIEADSPSVYGD